MIDFKIINITISREEIEYEIDKTWAHEVKETLKTMRTKEIKWVVKTKNSWTTEAKILVLIKTTGVSSKISFGRESKRVTQDKGIERRFLISFKMKKKKRMEIWKQLQQKRMKERQEVLGGNEGEKQQKEKIERLEIRVQWLR